MSNSTLKLYRLMLQTQKEWKPEYRGSNGASNRTVATMIAVEEELNRLMRDRGGVMRINPEGLHEARIFGREVEFMLGEAVPDKPVAVIDAQVKQDGGWVPFMDWKQRFNGRDLLKVLRRALNTEAGRSLERRIGEIERKGLREAEMASMRSALADFKYDPAKVKKAELDRLIPTGRTTRTEPAWQEVPPHPKKYEGKPAQAAPVHRPSSGGLKKVSLR